MEAIRSQMPVIPQKTRIGPIAGVLVILFLWSKGLGLEILQVKFRGVEVLPVFATAIAIIWFSAALIYKAELLRRNWYVKALAALALIVLIPTAVVSIGIYGLPLSILWRKNFLFAIYLIFPALIMSQLTIKETEILMKWIIGFCIVAGCVWTAAYWFPDVADLMAKRFISQRLGKPRVGVALILNFVLLALLYFTAKFFVSLRSRSWFGPLAGTIFFLWVVLFVWATRQITLQLLVTSVVAWIIKAKPKTKFGILYVAISAILFMFLLFPDVLKGIWSGYFEAMMSSLSDEVRTKTGTVGIRLEALSYYYKEFVATYFIGFGPTTTTDPVPNPITKGQLVFLYNPNDLGMLGLIFRYGIPVLIFVIVVMIKLEKDIIKGKRFAQGESLCILIAYELFLLKEAVSFPLCMAFFLPKFSLFWALFLFFVWRLSKQTVDQKHVSLVTENRSVVKYATPVTASPDSKATNG